MSHDTALSIGIDVSGTKLHVARSDRRAVREFAYDDEGLARLLDFVAELAPERIAFEATGGLERRLAVASGKIAPGDARFEQKQRGVHEAAAPASA